MGVFAPACHRPPSGMSLRSSTCLPRGRLSRGTSSNPCSPRSLSRGRRLPRSRLAACATCRSSSSSGGSLRLRS
eukprot:2480385-Alexandrium_andersonii.AAC.1